MKKLKLIRLIASSLVIASIIVLNPIRASAEWRQDGNGWWYTEGNSWATGWFRDNDGKLYYFDEYGYMAHDTIINGDYLDHNGSLSNSITSEIQKYIELLDDTNWQEENGIIFDYNGKSTIDKNIIIDIDQDGTYEMLLHHGSCEANLTTSVVTYNNGDIKIEHLPCDHGGYRGYSSSQKVFFLGGSQMDLNYTIGYKLENGSCKQVYSSTSYEYNGNSTYTVEGQNVSKEEYDESFKPFGDIVR